MTRINLVPPDTLSDQHLMAEYRELPRIFTAVRKLYAKGKTLENVHMPDQYVLGAGHCTFFYNRLGWLKHRFRDLAHELVVRGFKINQELFHQIERDAQQLIDNCPDQLLWVLPTPEEFYLNMARLTKRSGFDRVTKEISHDI